MNVSIWVTWVVVALLAILSVMWLMGKCGLLIAGFNTSSKEEKQRYDETKLCRVMGGGFSVITIILGIFTFYRFELPLAINWIIPWGVLGTLAVMVILANTICRATR